MLGTVLVEIHRVKLSRLWAFFGLLESTFSNRPVQPAYQSLNDLVFLVREMEMLDGWSGHRDHPYRCQKSAIGPAVRNVPLTLHTALRRFSLQPPSVAL